MFEVKESRTECGQGMTSVIRQTTETKEREKVLQKDR